MRYNRNRYSKPTPRDMVVKYAGPCACCGATIPAGTWATYYPAGTIGNSTKGAIAHAGGLDGNSQTCFANLRKQQEAKDTGFVDLDRAYEDSCADICGR